MSNRQVTTITEELENTQVVNDQMLQFIGFTFELGLHFQKTPDFSPIFPIPAALK